MPDWSGHVFIKESGVQFQEINDFNLLSIILCIQKGALTTFITYYKNKL
jgi:hypothetical protein